LNCHIFVAKEEGPDFGKENINMRRKGEIKGEPNQRKARRKLSNE